MKHARADYNRIQDPDGFIPDDEPVFLIRGQDLAGPGAVRTWAYLAKLAGAHHNIVEAALDQASAMDEWQRTRHFKVPDLEPQSELLGEFSEGKE